MLHKFNTIDKIRVSPHSDYYAIVPQDESFRINPLMLIVDRELSILVLVVKDKRKKQLDRDDISAAILPSKDYINLELCKTLLDVDSCFFNVIRIPLVAEEHGSLRTSGNIVLEYR